MTISPCPEHAVMDYVHNFVPKWDFAETVLRNHIWNWHNNKDCIYLIWRVSVSNEYLFVGFSFHVLLEEFQEEVYANLKVSKDMTISLMDTKERPTNRFFSIVAERSISGSSLFIWKRLVHTMSTQEIIMQGIWSSSWHNKCTPGNPIYLALKLISYTFLIWCFCLYFEYWKLKVPSFIQ